MPSTSTDSDAIQSEIKRLNAKTPPKAALNPPTPITQVPYNPSGSLPAYTVTIVQSNRNLYVSAPFSEDTFNGPGANAHYSSPLSAISDSLKDANGSKALSAFGYRLQHRVLSGKIWDGSDFGESMSLKLIFQAESDPFRDVLEPVLNLLAMCAPDVAQSGLYKTPGPHFETPEFVKNILNADVAKSAQNVVSGAKAVVSGAGNIKNAASDYAVSGAGKVAALFSGGASSAVGKLTSLASSAASSFSNIGPASVSLASSAVASIPTVKDIEGLLKNKISIKIGEFLKFDNVVINSVTPNWTWMPVGTSYGKTDGYLARCEVDISFSPFFAYTVKDFQDIFIAAGGSSVAAWYQALNNGKGAGYNTSKSNPGLVSKLFGLLTK